MLLGMKLQIQNTGIIYTCLESRGAKVRTFKQ